MHVRYVGGSKTATSVLISFQAEFANNVQRIVPNHCATRKGNLAESLSGFFGAEFWHALSCQRFSAFLGLQRSGDIFSHFFLHRPPQIRVLTHNEDNNILQQASLQTIIGAKFGHTALPGVSKKKGETCIGKHYVWLFNPTVSMPWNDFRLLIFWLQ